VCWQPLEFFACGRRRAQQKSRASHRLTDGTQCPDLGGIRTLPAAVWKRPARGARLVRRLSIDGDGQGDLAVLAVAPAHSGE
jgi:hypothetical protein